MNVSFESLASNTPSVPPRQETPLRGFSDHTDELIETVRGRLEATNDRIREIEHTLSSVSFRSLFSRAALQEELTRCYHDRHRLEDEIAQLSPLPMEVVENGVVLEEEGEDLPR